MLSLVGENGSVVFCGGLVVVGLVGSNQLDVVGGGVVGMREMVVVLMGSSVASSFVPSGTLRGLKWLFWSVLSSKSCPTERDSVRKRRSVKINERSFIVNMGKLAS